MLHETARRLRERVRQFREVQGLTQERFAEQANLSYKHYQAIEAGQKENLELLTVIKLAAGARVEIRDLFDFDTPIVRAVAEEPGRARYRAQRRRSR